jgi:quercetin 2,3-dioxygenase
MITLRPATARGHANHGWLDTWHTFSFADYYDPQWMGFRSLRVINDDRVAPGMGFGTHPHRDMEIITYVIKGELEHKDSMGNGRIIRAGEVQYMAAGTGVRHSEFNPSKSDWVHLLQIWIQPDKQGVSPRYADRALDMEDEGFQLVASREGRDGSFSIHQDTDLWLGRFEPGTRATHQLAPGRHAWLHVAEGEILLDGIQLASGDAIAVSEQSSLEFLAQKTSQVLLFDLN